MKSFTFFSPHRIGYLQNTSLIIGITVCSLFFPFYSCTSSQKKDELLNAKKTVETKEVKINNSPTHITTSAVVRAIPSHYAEVASPFGGRVVKSYIKIGQKVVAGSPIFEISSPAFFEASKSYFQSKQEMDQSLKNLNRERDLFKNGVGVEKELEQAEVEYRVKEKEYQNAVATLKVFSVDPQTIVFGQPLIIRSPISGQVVKNNIVIGQYLKDDAEPPVAITNLDQVWVVAHVKEEDICHIEQLETVEIFLTAFPNDTIRGKIFHINDLLEPDTRAIEVVIECDNSDRRLKPFMYGTVNFTNIKREEITVPKTAVFQSEGSSYVMVDEGNNEYRKQKVSVRSSDKALSVVDFGLKAGGKVVSKGIQCFFTK